MAKSKWRSGTETGTLLPAKYDLVVTDENDETTGLVIDWRQGGYSWTIDKPQLPTNNSAPTVDTGEAYDIRDANDYYRIIFTDWVKGAGQESRDETGADAALFWESDHIDVSRKGYFRLGPEVTTYTTTPAEIDGPIYAALKTQGGATGITDSVPAVFAAFTPSGSGNEDSVRYTDDSATWQKVDFDTAPSGSVSCFCDDGEHVYVAFSGTDGVYQGHADDASSSLVQWAKGADADGIVAMAYCNGVIYAAKGGATTAAQLGSFDMAAAPDAVWTKLSTHYVSHGAVTAGLVAMGPYVYWTLTNGVRTTMYKCSTHTSTDTFEEYAEFPSGFVALCSVAYCGVIYVGGYYDGPEKTGSTNPGVGAIYACTDAGPALIAQMGNNDEDWRVFAMTAYEKNLYYLCQGKVWRYDLVNGGYSHWFDVVTTGDTGSITWDTVEATMTAEPTAPDWTVTTTGSPTRSVASGILTISGTGGTDAVNYVRADSSITPATGTTLEVAFPANAAQGNWFYLYIDDATDKFLVVIEGDPGRDGTYSSYDTINLRVATAAGAGAVTHASWDYGDTATVRMTLQNGVGRLYLNNQLVRVTTDLAAGSTKSVAFGASGTVVTPNEEWDYQFKVDNLKYSHAGAYDPTNANTGTSYMTAIRDAVWVATKDVEIRKQIVGEYEASILSSYNQYAATGFLTSSRSTARMSTIKKYFASIDVVLSRELVTGESVAVQSIIDGVTYDATAMTSASTETVLVFDIHREGGVSGHEIAVKVILNGPGESTPEVKHVAVKFTPMTTSNVLHSFTCNLRDHVQSGIKGFKYDEDPDEVIGDIVGWANKVLTVEYAGLAFKGKLEAIEAKGYPQSRKQVADQQGTVRLTFREMG